LGRLIGAGALTRVSPSSLVPVFAGVGMTITAMYSN
jgi:hypothetical protein